VVKNRSNHQKDPFIITTSRKLRPNQQKNQQKLVDLGIATPFLQLSVDLDTS